MNYSDAELMERLDGMMSWLNSGYPGRFWTCHEIAQWDDLDVSQVARVLALRPKWLETSMATGTIKYRHCFQPATVQSSTTEHRRTT